MSRPLQNQEKSKKQKFTETMQSKGKNAGIAHKTLVEPVPTYEKGQCEKVDRGENNSFIILGRDRPNNLFSGFGAKGATQAGRIDLIVGLAGGEKGGPPDGDIRGPNFAMDSARVYISQKADIDKYMGLAQSPNQAKPGSSAIGMKADAIRLHARNDIKIVTGRARIENAGSDGEKLGGGGINQRPGTISLIAGNYTKGESAGILNMLNPKKSTGDKNKLQPIPKGDNLAECLEEIIDVMGELAAQIGTNTSLINQMNTALLGHIHMAGPIPTTPSPVYAPVGAVVTGQAISAIASRTVLTSKLETMKINHLNKFAGKNYINSKYVFTT